MPLHDATPSLPMPLQGVKVLDMSRVLAGPYCAMMLGDLGAEVIKVESPLGDDTRSYGPPYQDGESAYYLCCNRNKRDIVIDFSTPAGREVAVGLALRADVLIENFMPGKMEVWGLGYEQLREGNPGLVYCSISGYGRTGPGAHMPGYDYVVQGAGGIMSITGEPEGPPVKVGVAIVDLMAGSFAASAILAALRVRDRAGAGQLIDISLFDSHLAWMANVASSYLVSGEVPQRYGNAHPSIVPYQAFAASDGWLIVAVGSERQWQRLCASIGRTDLLRDPRFATNRERVQHRVSLVPQLQAVFSSRTLEEWLGLLGEAGVPCGPVNTIDRALNSPEAAARGMVQEVPHPALGSVKQVASPLRLTATPPQIRRHPPMLGEHTDSILAEELGLGPDQIAVLRASGGVA